MEVWVTEKKQEEGKKWKFANQRCLLIYDDSNWDKSEFVKWWKKRFPAKEIHIASEKKIMIMNPDISS